jgi:ParB/RepB/Spo0J family partition protein
MNDKIINIEHHQIDMRYLHTRIIDKKLVEQLRQSIKTYKQLRPVYVIKDQNESNHFILIDGYLRVLACKECGLDTVTAILNEDDEEKAILNVLKSDQQRPFQAIEEGLLLNELANCYGRSMSELAQLIGRDKSWVQRRLVLVRDLPQSILSAVKEGTISAWLAVRILGPLARANEQHSKLLVDYLRKNQVSTRQMSRFFEHYKKSNKNVRENMCRTPELFLSSLSQRDNEQKIRKLIRGPEGQFLDDLSTIAKTIERLLKRSHDVFDPLHSDDYKKCVHMKINQIMTLMKILNERKQNDQRRPQKDNNNSSSTRNGDTSD